MRHIIGRARLVCVLSNKEFVVCISFSVVVVVVVLKPRLEKELYLFDTPFTVQSTQ